jgi:hypothetical protein
MFTAKQYRDKAAEYKQLTDTALTLNEKREYRNLSSSSPRLRTTSSGWSTIANRSSTRRPIARGTSPPRFPACRGRHPHRRFLAMHERVVTAHFTPPERKA